VLDVEDDPPFILFVIASSVVNAVFQCSLSRRVVCDFYKKEDLRRNQMYSNANANDRYVRPRNVIGEAIEQYVISARPIRLRQYLGASNGIHQHLLKAYIKVKSKTFI
jgi:predicted RNA polymerase sigma factor